MKPLLLSILTCVMVMIFTLTPASPADAQPSPLRWDSLLHLADTPAASKDWMTQLETEILPQIETIFTPAQREQFKTAITNGTSFRKAFKSLTLAPDQKAQLKTLLKSVSKKDAFASLTPEQKKQLFLKKKALFRPTSEEITEKINTSMQGKGVSLPAGVKEKIEAGLKNKNTFIPTPESIAEKIKAGMDNLKEQIQD